MPARSEVAATDELFAALRKRDDGGFELLHGSVSEWVAHETSVCRSNMICVDRRRGGLHIRCSYLWCAPHL